MRTAKQVFVAMLALVGVAGCGDSGSRGASPSPAGETTRVSVGAGGVQANGSSSLTAISADGRIVAFASRATNLTQDATDCGNDCVFVHDRATAKTTRLPIQASSVLAPALSADGRLVAVTAQQTVSGDNAVFVFDRASGTAERIDMTADGAASHAPGNFLAEPAISADGRFVAFGSDASDLVAGDGNGVADVFVRDRLTGTTERVSVSSAGAEANATSGFFIGPALSADGLFVVFKSKASNLVPDDHNDGQRCLDLEGCGDVFVRDRQAGTTERVNVASNGMEANGASSLNIQMAISGDGRLVVFLSNATNLVPGDVDQGVLFFDVYLHDRATGATTRMSAAADGTRANASSAFPAISPDGRFVTFASGATNLLGGAELDCAGDCCSWVYRREVASGKLTIANVAADGHISSRSCVFNGALSRDGSFVAFSDFANDLVPSDTNHEFDVFVRGPLHD